MNKEDAEAFNAYTADWKNRIDTMLKTIIFLSGGVMSITIGAYINSQTDHIPQCASAIINLSWYLLAASLVSSLLVYLVVVISGAIVLKAWEKESKINKDGKIIIDSPMWIYVSGWGFAIIAVLSCIAGLILTAHGASYLIK
jgi:hypothetical protein